MPPDKVRPPGGQPWGAQEKAPDDGLLSASLPPTTKTNQARLLAEIEKLLRGPARCVECLRPLTALRSIQLGYGRVCWLKRRPGGVS